jgi:hypothetical protein
VLLAAASVPVTATQAPPASADPGQVRLRDLRIVQLYEGHDGAPHQLAAADKSTVLRIMCADLAWLERDGRDDDGGGA